MQEKRREKRTGGAELSVDDISSRQAILKQQFVVGGLTNCLLSHTSEAQSEPLWVQTVYIKVQDEFDLTKMRDWQLSETGTPYLIQRGRRFVDPRHMWGRYWPYRSTLIKQVGTSEWILAELSGVRNQTGPDP